MGDTGGMHSWSKGAALMRCGPGVFLWLLLPCYPEPLVGVYVGFCALRWLYTSCEVLNCTSSTQKFAGDKLTHQLFVKCALAE